MRKTLRTIAAVAASTGAAAAFTVAPADAATYPTLVFDQDFGVCEAHTSDVAVPFSIRTGDRVSITATGEIWSGVWFQSNTKPVGRWNEYGDNPRYPLPGARKFSLLVKMDGGYRYAGDSFSRSASYAYDQSVGLRINDDAPRNGSGCFLARVRVYR